MAQREQDDPCPAWGICVPFPIRAMSADSGTVDESVLELGTAPIQIYLFGGLSVFKRGLPIRSCGGARTEALLMSLALGQRRGVARERLVAQVWRRRAILASSVAEERCKVASDHDYQVKLSWA